MNAVCQCRNQFTAEDFSFVIKTLTRHERASVSLSDLLTDDNVRDAILDLDQIYQALIEQVECLQISPAFYFYVTTRHVLKKAEMDTRDLADYVASVLVNFTDSAKLKRDLAKGGLPPAAITSQPYVVDILNALTQANPKQAWRMRIYLANYTLFLSGIFSERVKAMRDRRGGPDLHFYEQIGQTNYHVAAQSRMAHEAHLDQTFEELSQRFHEIRMALNDLTENVLHVSDHFDPTVLPS
jgi:hypothetical protein